MKREKVIKVLSALEKGGLFKESDYTSTIYVKGETINQSVECYTYNTGTLNTKRTFKSNKAICTKFNL